MKNENAQINAINAAMKYVIKHKSGHKPAPLVIGRDVPACPPMEQPLWEYNKAKFGFTLPDRLVRWVQTA